jgi:hypothetical protein
MSALQLSLIVLLALPVPTLARCNKAPRPSQRRRRAIRERRSKTPVTAVKHFCCDKGCNKHQYDGVHYEGA